MKQEQSSNTEQRILEAAEKLFKEKGFALTSTVEIAREAGCNQALVHYYFRSKEKLFTKVFTKIANQFLSAFMEIDEQEIPFEEKIKLKIESHFDVLAENPRFPLFFFNEISSNPERLNTVKEQIGHIPKTIIARLQKDIDSEIKKGNMIKIGVYDLIMTVISLNLMLFMAKPLFQIITGIEDEEFQKFVAHRKKENVRIILNSLKP